jgi:T4 bacteriophage base plate protein
MELPKLNYPTFTIQVPKDSKKYTFRPILVKEEKLLLMSKESNDNAEVFSIIKRIVQSCCLDATFDVNKIPLFALEYYFMKLRAFSIGDVISVGYRDKEDGKIYDFEVDLKKVDIKYPEENIDTKIQVNKNAGIIMKYPMADLYDDTAFLNMSTEESLYNLVVKCIDKIYDNDKVYESKEYKEEDLLEFVELLDVKSFDKIRKFLSNMPTLHYEIVYKNSLGNERKIELNTLTDFFTLR